MSEFLAEARVLIRPDTTKFRAELQREIAAATAKPVIVPVQFVAGGAGVASTVATETASLAAAQGEAAASTAGLTRAAQAENAALVQQTVALDATQAATLRKAGADQTAAVAAREAAAAEAARARTLNSVETAAVASGASMLGLRGAVLTASAAFLGATVAFQSLGKSIKAASDTAEEFNKTSVVFGESSKQIRDFADTAATSLGISNLEALRAAGIFGNLFRSIQIAQPAAADMSEALVRLASDLASFNNADPTEVLANIRSGLAGEPEPLRKFGIFLSQARAQQEALIATGKEQVSQLTNAEIVQARYNIILRDSTVAQGDFARTSEGLANQTRILNAEIADLSAQLGSLLIPPLRVAVGLLAEYAREANIAAEATKNFADRLGVLDAKVPGTNQKVAGLVKNFAEFSARTIFLGPVLGTTTFALSKLGDGAEKAKDKITDLAHSFPAAGRAAHDMALQINELKDVLSELSGLEFQQLQIQTGLAPGGRGAEEANLRAQIEADKRAVEAAKSGSKARRQALEELAADQRALEALQEKDAQEAEQAANSRKDAAQRALQAQEEADQTFLELLSTRRDDQSRRIATAQDTASLRDDIQAQNNLQALIKQQIAKIRERVKSEQARRDAIRELRIALIASRAEEERLREEQRKQAQEQASTILDIKIQIAETKGQVALEKRLLQEKIRRLKAQIKAAKGNKLLVAQLRLELAQTQKELEDLNKQQEDTNKAGKTLAQSQFEFMQSLQGFSANLLGNLIPGFATGGLVGNTSQTAGGDLSALKGAPQDRVSQAAAVRGAQDRGVRPIQVDTTNQLLRQILRTLQGHHAGTGHPEIAHNRRVGAALMDTLGTVHGA